MSDQPRYIHIRNWDRYQHPDVTRGKATRAPWIRDHLEQRDNDEWLALSLAERGLLTTLRLAYAARKCEGIPAVGGPLTKVVGASVRPKHVKRLSDAGFILLSPGKFLENSSLDLDGDGDVEKPLAPAAHEPVDNSKKEQPVRQLEKADFPANLPGNGRPRDDVWDALEAIFGPVADKTNAHKKRNKATADLRRLGATGETVRLAFERWPRVFRDATATDTALATHYPQIVGVVRQQRPACAECGVGGGLHIAGCSRSEAA